MIQWVRLSLSLYVLGFIVARFRRLSDGSDGGATAEWLGVVFVLVGGVHATLAAFRYVSGCRAFVAAGALESVPKAPMVSVIATVAIGALLLAVLTTNA